MEDGDVMRSAIRTAGSPGLNRVGRGISEQADVSCEPGRIEKTGPRV